MQSILITGGSSGIGEAVAYEMAAGNSIHLTGRDEARLARVAERVKELGGICSYSVGDTRHKGDVLRIYEEAKKSMGSVTSALINAGVGRFGPINELTEEDFDIQFDTNVKAVYLWLHELIPDMLKANAGVIVVTSSNLGFETGARCALYAATKHAVQAMVGAVREEVRGTQIKIGTLNPGSVDTPWFDGKDVNRERMLAAADVAKAARLLFDQSETSNISHILLKPGKL